MGVTMLQVAPFCKSKLYVTTNDIINFNLSTDGVIALNKFLLTFMQDEVHRFTITYHRQIRSKGLMSSLLDEVPKIGEKRKKLLLRKFGSHLRYN